MKSIKWISLVLLVLLALAACAPPGETPVNQPDSTETAPAGAPTLPVASETPVEIPKGPTLTPYETEILPPAAVLSAQEVLAERLNVSTDAIQIRSIEQEQWPDACLGLAQPDELCLQVITDGFQVIFVVDGQTYEYRTNMNGSAIRAAEGPLTGGQGDTPLPVAVMAARQALARQLGIRITSVSIASYEQVDWPNSCLGAPRPNELCAEVITPGYSVILEHTGQRYEYHTDEDGSQVVEAQVDLPGDEEIVLTWRREGGIAGFCDDLVVYQDGQVVAASCRGGMQQELGRSRLTSSQLAQLNAWYSQFDYFEYIQKDPAVADAMTITLVFDGAGSEQPTTAEQEELALFAQDVYNSAAQ